MKSKSNRRYFIKLFIMIVGMMLSVGSATCFTEGKLSLPIAAMVCIAGLVIVGVNEVVS